MLNSVFTSKKMLCFVCGALSATVGAKLLKSETSHKLCVKGLANGMKMKDDVLENIQNIREEASDIYHDANNKAEVVE